ncbi:MAG TPA: nucleotide exchange factor GrpE [Xanthobacteraceae bacterium]|nr:nucleotide exchange factor GrpE [Xanthobacteraceae bacterium]
MTDTTTRGPQCEPAEDESLRNATEAAAPAPEAAGDPVPALTQEVAELKDKLLRTLAEMENLRRRTEREVADARVYGIAAFARDVVGVADNMRRALEAVGPEMRESADAQVKALIEGVDLTERELLKSLEKHGITKIDPQGEKFDPHLHQAMFEVPDPERTAGTVVQVVQPGYKIGERVLRPALVGVAKGGPKPGAEQPANDNPSAST